MNSLNKQIRKLYFTLIKSEFDEKTSEQLIQNTHEDITKYFKQELVESALQYCLGIETELFKKTKQAIYFINNTIDNVDKEDKEEEANYLETLEEVISYLDNIHTDRTVDELKRNDYLVLDCLDKDILELKKHISFVSLRHEDIYHARKDKLLQIIKSCNQFLEEKPENIQDGYLIIMDNAINEFTYLKKRDNFYISKEPFEKEEKRVFFNSYIQLNNAYISKELWNRKIATLNCLEEQLNF